MSDSIVAFFIVIDVHFSAVLVVFNYYCIVPKFLQISDNIV